MRDDKLIVPRIASPLAGESVGVGQWKAIDFPASGRGRSPFVATRAYYAEENQMIAMPEETFSRFTEALERIAEVVERLGPKDEAKEEPIQRTLTPQEASKILRLNVQTVMDWCRTGKLKGIKIGGNEINGRGGKWLIPRDEIDAYLRRDRLIKGPRKGGAK